MANKSILIIEDEKGIRDVLKTALEMENYQVMVADNGKHGLDVLQANPLPGLILLDLQMPVMTGWEFIQEIKKYQRLNEIPIIVVSAFMDRVKNLDCADFVLKPLEMDHLLQTIESNIRI